MRYGRDRPASGVSTRIAAIAQRLQLLDRAPPRGAPAHLRPAQLGPAARAVPALLAVGDERAGVNAALADRRARGRADVAAQAVELGVVEVAGRPQRRELRAPQRLV